MEKFEFLTRSPNICRICSTTFIITLPNSSALSGFSGRGIFVSDFFGLGLTHSGGPGGVVSS